MKALLVPMVLALSLIPDLAEAAPKYNVCSVTLNSSDEIDTFKKTMGSKSFNYIELTQLPEAENEESGEWLDRACAAKIQCDILIVSGHFGGSFFGSSGLSLSMETMEQAACKPGCEGVFKKPKEVFLFGCNTLAGKDGDTRTPEQYRQVLMEDGFDNETAEQIVAFRYSAMGTSYADRMRGVFSGVPRIYGFDSIAPAGKNVEDLLENYFKQAEKTGYYSKGGFMTAGASVNKDIKQALKITNFAQAEGLHPDENYTSAVCFLNDPNTTGTAKMKWIEEALTGKEMLAHLPYITQYFDTLRDPESGGRMQWTDQTYERFENTAKFAQAKAVLHDLVLKPLDSIISVQAKAVEFQDFMGWLKAGERQELLAKLFLGNEKTKWSRERVDAVRSAIPEDYRFELGLDRIPAGKLDDPYFREALISLKPKNRELIETIVKYIAIEGDQSDIMQLTGPTGDSPEVQRYLARLTGADVSLAGNILDFGHFSDPEAESQVKAAMQKTWKRSGDSEQFWKFVAQSPNFKALPEGIPEVFRSLVQKYSDQKRPLLPHTCNRLYNLLRANAVPLTQAEKWPALLSGCEPYEARALVSHVLYRSDLTKKIAEDFALAALTLSNPLHKDSGIAEEILRALRRVGGPFERFDPAFRAYYAKLASSVTGPDIASLKRLKFLLLDHLGNSPQEKLELVNELLADKDRDSYLPTFLESDLADVAARKRGFRAKWESSSFQSNDMELFVRVVINTPSLMGEFMPQILEKGAGPSTIYGLKFGDAAKRRLDEKFRSAEVMGPFLAMLKKLDPASTAAKKGRELLRGIKPLDAAAADAIRAAAADADAELADTLRTILAESGDEATKAAFLKSLEPYECGIPQEVYFSNLARFFREPLMEIAKKEVSAGLNETVALSYLIKFGPDKPETEPYLRKYVELMLRRRIAGGGEWLTPQLIMGLNQLAAKHPGKYDALVREALKAYQSEGESTDSQRQMYRLALVGVIANGLPDDAQAQALFDQKLNEVHSQEALGVLFTAFKGRAAMSANRRELLLAKLGQETDPNMSAALLSYFLGGNFSLAEKNRITEVVRHAPEEVRRLWFDDTGHR